MRPAELLPPSLLFTSGWEGKRCPISLPAAEEVSRDPPVGFSVVVWESSLAMAAEDGESHLPVESGADQPTLSSVQPDCS